MIDLDDLADHGFVTFEGAFILARALGDPGHIRSQLRVLRQMLQAVPGTSPPTRSVAKTLKA